ncbi:IscS subfamily cysteine desulfurase [Bacillus sp. 2205SS5-2]|uniref:IscS subfamily cysteine desulfurase n=1 Tax=Bacillus sp. 2205SS5-2 TaxID=3109031 RepID=UPI003004B094
MKYFDFAATTPIDSDALQAYTQVAKNYFGNTSSLHDEGSKAKQLLETCRQEWATRLNIPSEGIHFTSGGTESNLIGIISLALSQKKLGNHIITTMGEHNSIHSAFEYLENRGFQVTKLPLDQNGQLSLTTLKENIREDTILLSVQIANGEIGSLQPIEAIAELVQKKKILLHCDAVQSFGKMSASLQYVDSFSISSHKIYGPKGVGLLYINPLRHPTPLFPGQTHEGGLRGGTVDLPSIAAFTVAGEKMMQIEQDRIKAIRQLFLTELRKQNLKIRLYQHSNPSRQLPHVVGLGLCGLQGQWVMLEANRKGFGISTGSACSIGQQDSSKTIKAMGISDEQAKEFIRISFSHFTSDEDVIELAHTLKEIVDDAQHLQNR